MEVVVVVIIDILTTTTAPLKLRPYGAIQMCTLLLLLLLVFLV